jgi:hypothetical protein
MTFHVPEQYRLRRGPLPSSPADGNNGAFLVPLKRSSTVWLKVIASDGEGWEHASVSLEHRIPTWAEMACIKALFWDPEDCVIQYHPPASDYVNRNPHCLHLWRPIGIELPRPPMRFV